MNDDPTTTNSDLYKIVFENDRVRVLEYLDQPGDQTTPHSHPDSVMITLSDFDRRLSVGDQQREVSLTSGLATWLPAQSHSGENIGTVGGQLGRRFGPVGRALPSSNDRDGLLAELGEVALAPDPQADGRACGALQRLEMVKVA